jgi:hypothetical protein
MPSRVPHRLFLQRLILQLRNNLVTYLRFMLVCFIWLGLVPFVARWIWRFYFRFGDWSAIPTPPTVVLPDNTTHTTDNVTDLPSPSAAAIEDTVGNATSGGVLEEGFFGWLRGQDVWTAILRDCFQGQIITICLVAVFVVVFLIREWVMQNAVAVIEEPPVDGGRQGIPAVRLPENHGQIVEQEIVVHEDLREATPATAEEVDYPDDENGEYAFDDDPLERVDLEYNPWTPNTHPPPQPLPAQVEPLVHPPTVQAAEPPIHVAVQNFEVDPPLPRNNDFFDDDDLDADDFDGLWDILGMQGPIIGLLHNTVFSALMIALAVGLGVWLPFMFGKTALGALVYSILSWLG